MRSGRRDAESLLSEPQRKAIGNLGGQSTSNNVSVSAARETSVETYLFLVGIRAYYATYTNDARAFTHSDRRMRRQRVTVDVVLGWVSTSGKCLQPVSTRLVRAITIAP